MFWTHSPETTLICIIYIKTQKKKHFIHQSLLCIIYCLSFFLYIIPISIYVLLTILHTNIHSFPFLLYSSSYLLNICISSQAFPLPPYSTPHLPYIKLFILSYILTSHLSTLHKFYYSYSQQYFDYSVIFITSCWEINMHLEFDIIHYVCIFLSNNSCDQMIYIYIHISRYRNMYL